MTRLSRGFGLLVSFATALTLTVGFAPMAQADPPAAQDQVMVGNIGVSANPSAKLVDGLFFSLYQNGGNPVAGTEVHISTFSCGRFLQENTHPMYSGNTVAVMLSPDGEPDFGENSVNKLVSKSIEYQIDVVQPGYDAYHLSGSVTDYGTVDGKPLSSYRPTCDQVNGGGSGGSSCVVTANARELGNARVGHTVKVRKPKTNGQCGKTSYTWKIAGKTVKKGKSLHLTQSMKGKSVLVKVTLSRGPDKVLRFGRVK